jgi:hypothetical protein
MWLISRGNGVEVIATLVLHIRKGLAKLAVVHSLLQGWVLANLCAGQRQSCGHDGAVDGDRKHNDADDENCGLAHDATSERGG